MSATSPDRIRVSVPARLGYRDAVGALIRAVCVQLEESRRARLGTADQVLSAFNEAFNNLALHGYQGSEPGGVEVDVEIEQRTIVVRLSDRGHGFDPDVIQAPDLDGDAESVAEGGYGFYIMRSFMDQVFYQRGTAGQANVLTMIRDLDGDAPASSGASGPTQAPIGDKRC